MLFQEQVLFVVWVRSFGENLHSTHQRLDIRTIRRRGTDLNDIRQDVQAFQADLRDMRCRCRERDLDQVRDPGDEQSMDPDALTSRKGDIQVFPSTRTTDDSTDAV